MRTSLKVKSSTGISDKDFEYIKRCSRAKIKTYVEKRMAKDKAFRFYPATLLIERKITTKAYLKDNLICMNCGYSEEIASYAIAQNAMGYKVNFTCDCGQITSLPQII